MITCLHPTTRQGSYPLHNSKQTTSNFFFRLLLHQAGQPATMVDADDDLLIGRTLPDPSLTFTLPSIHDGTTLDCRVYHPYSLSISLRAPPWRRHAAIVAHPYAPLGGNCDDRIVDVTASTLLRVGYLVCTFNFRYLFSSVSTTLPNDVDGS